MTLPADFESAAERAFRRRFTNKEKGRDKRDDYALDLFREAQVLIDDVERVGAVLRELGKLYNPLTDGPIVDLASRRRIVEALHAGDRAGAIALLDRLRTLYAPSDQTPPASWEISQDP